MEQQQMQSLSPGHSSHKADYPDGYTSLKHRQEKRKGRRCCCVLGSLLLVLVFLSAVVILIVLMLMVGQRPPQVQTNCGKVQGEFDAKTNTFIFKGVPYAAAPVGADRWKPPVPLDNSTCWSDFKLVDRFPEPCAQRVEGSSKGYIGSEDCLYLNIYSPDTDPLEPVPVMVYIHGGYLQFGHINIDGYVPDEKTARELGVVFVNIQYRLNAFGWFVSNALPKEKGYTGNVGLLDQIQALRWVQQNIRNFGGDPAQVTVFGQSSGGTSVMMLLSTELAKGLFHRAWIISGSPILNKTYAEAAQFNQVFLNRTHCHTEECLLKLNTSDIVLMTHPEWDIVKDSMDLPTKGYFEPALPVIDGVILKKPVFEQWDQRMRGLPDVPVIIGTTAQEVDFGPAPGVAIEKWTMNSLYDYVSKRLGPFNETFMNTTIDLYPAPADVPAKYAPEYIFTTMATDVRITCGNEIMARKLAASQSSPVYRYVVTSRPSVPVRPFDPETGFPAKFAFHAWDIYAFFNTFRYILDGTSRSDEMFRDVLRENVMEFVRTGRVAERLWSPVPHFDDDDEDLSVVTALISSGIKVNASYNKPQCDFWNDNGFFGYSWIN